MHDHAHLKKKQSTRHRPEVPLTRDGRITVRSTFGDIGYIMREIHRTEGLKGLWRGIGPTLVGIVPARTVYFGFYNIGKEVYAPYLDNGE